MTSPRLGRLHNLRQRYVFTYLKFGDGSALANLQRLMHSRAKTSMFLYQNHKKNIRAYVILSYIPLVSVYSSNWRTFLQI